jgi:hypothetical protein
MKNILRIATPHHFFDSTMKLVSAAVLLATISNVAAFSAVAPTSVGAATGNPDPVDKSMRGIDKEPSTFDPTTGDSPALKRNNIDQVWVPQVRICVEQKMMVD